MKDKYNLKRFIDAQDQCYGEVLQELKNGRKQSHWMWFIFPQIIGLGRSEISQYYAIKSVEEAQEYMKNEILQKRMNEVCSILLDINTNDPIEVFGFIDSMKLKSSMTLFNIVNPDNTIFIDVINKFYNGEQDINTLELIKDLH